MWRETVINKGVLHEESALQPSEWSVLYSYKEECCVKSGIKKGVLCEMCNKEGSEVCYKGVLCEECCKQGSAVWSVINKGVLCEVL